MKLNTVVKTGQFVSVYNLEDMATASPFLSEDQFLCSICLEVFTEPVSLLCGHNFCKACIARHWEGKEQCQCPLCNERFSTGLKLCVNTGFREVVENFKKHHATADPNSLAEAGQVPCDCCLINKAKASKTCLVCLTSYCETHLEPHHRVAALKRHELTDPVHNLEDKICKKHNRILEPLIGNDQMLVCALCTRQSSPDTVPLEEEYVDESAQIVRKKEVQEVQYIKCKRGKKAKKTKVAVQTKSKGKDEEIAHEVVPHQIRASCIWASHEATRPFLGYHYLPAFLGASSGRFYYEVHTRGEKALFLGIVRESVLRKRTFIPKPSHGAWILWLEENTNNRALHNAPVDFPHSREPKRIKVLVDYKNGLVFFCDADNVIPFSIFTGCKFRERVFLFYSPMDDVSWAQRLQRKIKQVWSNIPGVILGLALFLLIVIWQCKFESLGRDV